MLITPVISVPPLLFQKGMKRLEVQDIHHLFRESEYLIMMQVGEIFNPFSPFTMKQFILPILWRVKENEMLQ